jgi:formamidopyrimidine-DNA glycosylase
MLEYPEIVTITGQAGKYLVGKTISSAQFLTPEKKFIFGANEPEEFSHRLAGRTVAKAQSCGNHFFLVSDTGNALNIGDTGGKILYHEGKKTIPKKRDVQIDFSDGTYLTFSMVMWGFVGAQTEEETAAAIKRIKDEAREPVRADVSIDEFLSFINAWEDAERVNAKKFIISRKFFTGFGNGYAQDILWRSGIHPRRKIGTLTEDEARLLFRAFLDVADDALNAGGRTIERNLLNQPGEYEPAMYRSTLGTPCPKCGAVIEKFAFEGGACYICPDCQKP